MAKEDIVIISKENLAKALTMGLAAGLILAGVGTGTPEDFQKWFEGTLEEIEDNNLQEGLPKEFDDMMEAKDFSSYVDVIKETK